MKVGFTGTRKGITPAQFTAISQLLNWSTVDEVHHGDCVGADAAMHQIAKSNGIRVVIHPPVDDRLQARCDGDVIMPPKAYLVRDADIVDETNVLIAAPAEEKEQAGGGTWFTVRYARAHAVPMHIVWPNGTVTQ